MSSGKRGANAALGVLFEEIGNSTSSLHAARARVGKALTREQQIVEQVLDEAIAARKNMSDVAKEIAEVLDSFLKKAKARREISSSIDFERERALHSRVIKSSDPPVALRRNDGRVIKEKMDIPERAQARVKELGASEKLRDPSVPESVKKGIRDEIDRIFNFGVEARHNTALGYFTGTRILSQNASAEEVAIAKAALQAKEKVLTRLHAEVLGKGHEFLEGIAAKVAAACKPLSDERAIRNKAKEILRGEFSAMRQKALDKVLADPAMRKEMESLGFVIKGEGEDVLTPRIYFRVELDKQSYKVGFDIDHSLVGFAETRDDFLQEVFDKSGKVIPEKLVPIFDKGNFTFETARNNRHMLEGYRNKDPYQAAVHVPLSEVQGKLGPSAGAGPDMANLAEIENARKKLSEVQVVVSEFESSEVKEALLDSLAELAAALGDSI